jgi:type I restriction enzyme S subunit
MKVGAGYKQTEAGIIPMDWSVKQLGEIADIDSDNLSAETPLKYAFNYISLEDVDIGTLRSHSEQVFRTAPSRARRRLELGDILISTVRPNLQSHLHFKSTKRDWVCSTGFSVVRSKSQIAISGYVFFHLFGHLITKQIEGLLTGSNYPSINGGDVKALEIPLPPLHEQRAIATALSDVDALLAAQDKLIAKKRDIKQAAMQQLLTGKQRLPGFSGKWEARRLVDICWFQEGPGVRTTQFTTQGIKLLNGTNIIRGKVTLETTNRYISEYEAFGCYKHFLVDDGDILIASSGVTIDKFHEKVAFASSENLPLCMNTSTIRFKPDTTELHEKFLYFFLQSDLFKEPIGKQATGSAQLNFGPAHLKKINVNLPPKMEEQTAIASVLSDMDAELTALEQQRDKTLALKQGMMQELLTGRIRLV